MQLPLYERGPGKLFAYTDRKICGYCGLPKTLSEFYFRKKQNGYSPYCKICHNEKQKQYQKNNYYDNLESRAKMILCQLKYRSRLKKLEYDLTLEWIIEKFKKGICEVSGLKIDFSDDNKSIKGPWGFKNPFGPNIDRIDNEKGYTKENCRLVISWINKAKSIHSDDIMIRICEAIVNYNRPIKNNMEV